MWFLIVNLSAQTAARVWFSFATGDLNWKSAELYGRHLLGDDFLCAELESCR